MTTVAASRAAAWRDLEIKPAREERHHRNQVVAAALAGVCQSRPLVPDATDRRKQRGNQNRIRADRVRSRSSMGPRTAAYA
jgi:hypothetical protein